MAAAEKVTPEMINFMATHGRGLICAPLTESRCKELDLHTMVRNNTDQIEKANTVSNDLKENLARKALPYIQENTVILIDGSTTNLQLVNALPINFKATVITNSPPIAMALAYHEQIEVLMIGGTLYKQSMVI